jgi:uncharacterized protein (TIGR02246 family)
VTLDDRRAVETAVGNWMNAWARGNPDLAVRDYAEETDWTNVLGLTCATRDELRTLLADMFSRPHVMAGRDTVVGQDIRFFLSDVAVVKTRVERRGQLLSTGEPMGTRYTTHLRVLVRGEEGWRIVSHLISDSRAEGGWPKH